MVAHQEVGVIGFYFSFADDHFIEASPGDPADELCSPFERFYRKRFWLDHYINNPESLFTKLELIMS